MKDETFAAAKPKSHSYACQIIITKQKTQCQGDSESKEVSFSNYKKCAFE